MKAEGSARFPGLDGLRAIAIALVLLFHLTPGRNVDQGLKSAVFKLADLGWAGVDLFFCLSGFLITTILLHAKAQGLPLRHFMRARVLRIVPAYFLALAVAFLIAPLVRGDGTVPDLPSQLVYWGFLGNYALGAPPFAGLTFGLDHFWSLGIEMQFYLAWPLVVTCCSERAIVRIAFAALAVANAGRIAAVLLGADWPVTYAWTPLRSDALLLGSLAAIAFGRKLQLPGRSVLAALLAAMALAGAYSWFGFGQAVLTGPGHGAVMAAGRCVLPVAVDVACVTALWLSLHSPLAIRVLAHRAFKPLARYSYGIYVVHFLLLSHYLAWFGPDKLKEAGIGADAAVYLFFGLASCVSFLVAMVSYHAFEIHFLRLKRADAPAAGSALAGGAS